MKVYITDAVSGCCPENVDMDMGDMARSKRIKAAVMKQIGVQPKQKSRNTVRIFLLAAAAAMLLTGVAYAVVNYTMSREETNGSVTGHCTWANEDGIIITDQEASYPDAGMVFTFTGPQESHNLPEFRAFWLPSENNGGVTDEEGWTRYLGDFGEGSSIPYIINAMQIDTGNSRYVLQGEPSVVKEERWGAWQITQISSYYGNCSQKFFYDNDTANYIFMFNEDLGFFVKISGTLDMETLEHIARELEIRESDVPAYDNEGMVESIGILDVGRG